MDAVLVLRPAGTLRAPCSWCHGSLWSSRSADLGRPESQRAAVRSPSPPPFVWLDAWRRPRPRPRPASSFLWNRRGFSCGERAARRQQQQQQSGQLEPCAAASGQGGGQLELGRESCAANRRACGSRPLPQLIRFDCCDALHPSQEGPAWSPAGRGRCF